MKNWTCKKLSFGICVWTCTVCAKKKGRKKLQAETMVASGSDAYRHYVDEYGDTLCGHHGYNCPGNTDR